MLKALRDYEQAKVLLEKAAGIMKVAFNADHPYVKRAENNLANLLEKMNNE